MKAVRFGEFGAPGVLKVVDDLMPKLGDGEALIKVHAAGLNPIDYKTRNGSGFVADNLKDRLPSGLGYDFSGEVVEINQRDCDFKAGDQVMGMVGFPLNPGSYVEYLCVSTGAIIQKPAKLSFLQAAALPTVGLTALQALNKAETQSGDVVLVHAGAGGVGHLAIQLAKQMGAYVITTASKCNHEFLQNLGADQCIDYHEADFVTAIAQPVDVVIDLMGGNVGIRSIDVLDEAGCIVTVPTVTAEKIMKAAKQKKRRALGLIKESNMKELEYLAELVSNDKLSIEISRIFQLSQAVEAHELLENGHVRGKLVFKI